MSFCHNGAKTKISRDQGYNIADRLTDGPDTKHPTPNMPIKQRFMNSQRVECAFTTPMSTVVCIAKKEIQMYTHLCSMFEISRSWFPAIRTLM